MYSTSKWAVETVDVPEPAEFPRMLIWKRTLLLGVLGIGIGLGGGYLLGRSKVAKDEPAGSAQRPIMRVKFLPLPDADPGERIRDKEGDMLETWMPPAADSPVDASAEDAPHPSKKRPAFFRLQNPPPRDSDKG
jgi:hypothetical protein